MLDHDSDRVREFNNSSRHQNVRSRILSLLPNHNHSNDSSVWRKSIPHFHHSFALDFNHSLTSFIDCHSFVQLMASTYPLTTVAWPSEDEGIIQIFDESEKRIALFSIEFLIKGKVCTWSYIHRACLACVEEAGTIRRPETPQVPISEQSLPARGTYLYVRNDGSNQPCTLSIGPRFHLKYRGPPIGPGSDTMSHSSRSSANQSRFRSDLLIRDGWCVITDSAEAIAAHILPQSRPEYYAEVFGYDVGYLFDVSYGLLLDPKVHHAFDRGELSLYGNPSVSICVAVLGRLGRFD
jgi:hypothetical protein